VLEELQPGDPQVIGPYRIVGQLGAGGMGRVFLGLSAGRRPVAVKVIRSDLAADPDFRVRFRREVAAARKVNGMFTAVLVDANVDAREPWLATAYVAGPSLAEAVREHGPLPVSSVLALTAGLAEGLAAIHAAGVVHRDLKPSNVLLADDGPRVIDFGISRAAELTAVTRAGFVIGSPGFMSPEQAEGGDVGPPSDMFSLGAVLAFAATGESPFGAGSTAALVYRVVHAPARLDGVPEQIRPLVERCLAKDPAQRLSASELLAAADAAHDSECWVPGANDGWVPGAIMSAFPAVPAPADAEARLAASGEAPADERQAAPSQHDDSTVTGLRKRPPETEPPEPDLIAEPVGEAEPIAAAGLAESGTVADTGAIAGSGQVAEPEPVSSDAPVGEPGLIPGLADVEPAAAGVLPLAGEMLIDERRSRKPAARKPAARKSGPRKAPARKAPAPASPAPASPPGNVRPAGRRPASAPGDRRLRVRRPIVIGSAAAVILVVALATGLSLSSGPGTAAASAGHKSATDTSRVAATSAADSPAAASSTTPPQSASATTRASHRPTAKPSTRPNGQAATTQAAAPTTGAGSATTPAARVTTHSTAPKPAPKPSHTSKPAPKRTAAAPLGFRVDGASADSCGDAGGLSSASGGASVSFGFTDDSSVSVSVYQIGTDGSQEYFATLAPGGELQVSATVGSYWMISSPGGCLGILDIAGGGQVTIT
jgi:eukaryotic-like serine/threonine-protein kinase